MQWRLAFASCGLGYPAPEYAHETGINTDKGLELPGIGRFGGRDLIRDPYLHHPCWIADTHLDVLPGSDLSQDRAMPPGVPGTGQWASVGLGAASASSK